MAVQVINGELRLAACVRRPWWGCQWVPAGEGGVNMEEATWWSPKDSHNKTLWQRCCCVTCTTRGCWSLKNMVQNGKCLEMNHLNHLLPQNNFFWGGSFLRGNDNGWQWCFTLLWTHEVRGPWAKVTLKFQGNKFFLNKCLRWVLPSLYWVHYIDKPFHKSQLQWRVANCIDLVVFYRILSYPLNDVKMLYFEVGGCFKIWMCTSNSRIMRFTPWTLAGRPLILWRCMWFYGTFFGRRCWDLVDEAWWGNFFIENCELFGASECPSTFQLGSTYLQQSCRDYSPVQQLTSEKWRERKTASLTFHLLGR